MKIMEKVLKHFDEDQDEIKINAKKSKIMRFG